MFIIMMCVFEVDKDGAGAFPRYVVCTTNTKNESNANTMPAAEKDLVAFWDLVAAVFMPCFAWLRW